MNIITINSPKYHQDIVFQNSDTHLAPLSTQTPPRGCAHDQSRKAPHAPAHRNCNADERGTLAPEFTIRIAKRTNSVFINV